MVPGVLVEDALYGRQPNPGALEVLGAMQPLEHAEQLVGVLHAEADAVVADEDHRMRRWFSIDPTSITARERGRVYLTALESRLVKTTSISAGSHSTNGSGWICQSMSRPSTVALQRRGDALDDRRQAGDLEPDVLPPEPREVQEVVHEQPHLACAVAHAAQIVARLLGQLGAVLVDQQFGEARRCAGAARGGRARRNR